MKNSFNKKESVQMEINKEIQGNELNIKVTGRLDTNTVGDLEKEIENLDGIQSVVFNYCRHVVTSLVLTCFIDTHALRISGRAPSGVRCPRRLRCP